MITVVPTRLTAPLESEPAYRRTWRTRDEAENALFAYIDGWYNSQRIQKKAGPAITGLRISGGTSGGHWLYFLVTVQE
ncbi:IS3 family transposase [Nocardia sp. IFM 10818]